MSPQGPALCIEQLGRRTKAATARAPHRTPTERLRCRISHASLAVEASVSNHDDHEAASSPMQVSSYQQELLGKMSKFMGPATLIPLGDPLMSLCDTVCIGQYAGTSELAALGPATMIFSFCQYFFQNLQVASLSVISSRLREGAQGAAARTLACALLLAAVAGTLTAAGLEAGAPWLLQAVGVKDAALLPMAADYMRVRALAQPAVLVTMVAQSGLLAQHDSLTPCISVLLAAAVSLAGNVVFVAGQGWGLTGAAVTTVATQYVAAGALMWSLQRSSSQLRPAWGLPRGSELWALLHTMAPLTVVSLSKHLCYLVAQTSTKPVQILERQLRPVLVAAMHSSTSLLARCANLQPRLSNLCCQRLPCRNRTSLRVSIEQDKNGEQLDRLLGELAQLRILEATKPNVGDEEDEDEYEDEHHGDEPGGPWRQEQGRQQQQQQQRHNLSSSNSTIKNSKQPGLQQVQQWRAQQPHRQQQRLPIPTSSQHQQRQLPQQQQWQRQEQQQQWQGQEQKQRQQKWQAVQQGPRVQVLSPSTVQQPSTNEPPMPPPAKGKEQWQGSKENE